MRYLEERKIMVQNFESRPEIINMWRPQGRGITVYKYDKWFGIVVSNK